MLNFSANAPVAKAKTATISTNTNFNNMDCLIHRSLTDPLLAIWTPISVLTKLLLLSGNHCFPATVFNVQTEKILSHAREQFDIIRRKGSTYQAPRHSRIFDDSVEQMPVVAIEFRCGIRKRCAIKNEYASTPAKFICQISGRFLRHRYVIRCCNGDVTWHHQR